MRKALLLFPAIVLAVCFHASATGWTKIPLRGGEVQQLLPDRSAKRVWFAINSDRLYRSADSGINWEESSLENVRQVIVHSSTHDVFAVAGAEGRFEIHRSTDGGETFALQSSIHGYEHHLSIHPDDPKTMFTFGKSNSDLGVSHDGGLHWERLHFPAPITLGCEGGCYYNWNDLLFSPQDHKTIYLSGGLYYGDPGRLAVSLFFTSTDNGKTWKTAKASELSFHTDPAFPARAFAFNELGLMELKAKGWQPISNLGLQEIASVPGARNILYGLHPVHAGLQIVRSTDGGKSWSGVTDRLYNAATHLGSESSALLLAGTDGAGVFRKNGSDAWRPSSEGFQDLYLPYVAASGNSVYAMTSPAIWIFRSQDGGANWVIRHVPDLIYIFANPGNPSHLIGITQEDRLIVSRNGGDSWTKSSIPEGYYYALAFDPSNPNTVYLGGSIEPVLLFQSTDGGITFQRTSAKFPSAAYSIGKIVVDRNNSQTIYLTTPDGVYKSMDAGHSVQKANAGIRCSRCPAESYSLVPLSQPNSYLIAMTDGGLFRTDNGGSNWVKTATIPGFFVSQMVSANQEATHLFALSENLETSHNELMESTDGGGSWNLVAGIDYNSIEIRQLSEAGSPVYMATDHGLLRSQ